MNNALETIDGVNDFECSNVELIWKKDTILLDRNIVFEGDIVFIDSDENLMIFEIEESGTFVIEKDTKSRYQIDKNGPIISRDLLLLGKWNADYSSRTLYAWDYKKNSKVWESESYFGKPVVFNGFLYGRLKTNLYRISPDTGQPIWHKNLEEYGSSSINGEQLPTDVQTYIGVYNDILYIKAGTVLILGVDISNGEEMFKYEYDKEAVVLDENNIQLDSENGVIFSIGRKNYFELDLSTKKASLYDHSGDTEKYGVETTRLGGWEGDQIYFWEGSINNKFGIFNRNSKTITFVDAITEVEGMFPAIKKLKFGKDRLYVLDHNNKLHIFGADNEVA